MKLQQVNEAADNLRILIMSMVEKAKSGHPGGAMGGADFANLLFSTHIVYDPSDPMWISRDRFFLDPGHMSPMLYGVLALTGRYSIEELKQLRQWGSVTPGHPEVDVMRGVDNSSGPLGQGCAMAVGSAIAERIICNRFGEVWSHKTYCFISDGGVQEEVSQGAGRLAGQLGLHNLIMFYDSNKVQLSTKVNQVSSEDTAAKYRAWGWNVLEVNGSDAKALNGALIVAKAEKERPTLIIGNTIMAKGAVKTDGTSLEGAISTHGQPLSKAGGDVDATIKNLGGDVDDPWKIFESTKTLYSERREELKVIVDKHKREQKEWAEKNPGLMKELGDWISGRLPKLDWDSIEFKPNMASRAASAAVLSFLAKNVKNMIVSSADLANSDKTDGFLKETTEIQKGNFQGAFLQSGVAELTMACVMNGISLHGGLFSACGTFFVFSDYEKPAIRLASLMELPVKYIFTHDSFRVGEDGPTHEPIEQEAQIRLLEQMNNLKGNAAALVLRPADSYETLESYKLAMENNESPTILIFSRQDLKDLPVDERRKQAEKTKFGGYAVNEVNNPDVVLVGNGSDVILLMEVAEALKTEGKNARVLSIPSLGLFMRQNKEYFNSLLPANIPVFGLTSGLPATLYPLMKGIQKWDVVGMERFGASAPASVLDKEFGYTAENILTKVKQFLF